MQHLIGRRNATKNVKYEALEIYLRVGGAEVEWVGKVGGCNLIGVRQVKNSRLCVAGIDLMAL